MRTVIQVGEFFALLGPRAVMTGMFVAFLILGTVMFVRQETNR